MIKKSLLLSGCALLLSGSLMAGGFKVALQGQKQTGMAGTGVGFAQDAATIYYNPAGMSFVGNQFSLGTNFLFPNTSFLDRNTNTLYDANSQMFTPFSLYGAFKLSPTLNLGLGVYTPFGTGMKYPSDWAGRYILREINLNTLFIQPTASWKIANNFSLGMGLVFARGQMSLNKDIPLTSGTDSAIGNASLRGNGSGFGYTLGAYLNASDNISIGATYHSRVNMHIKEGHATFSNIPAALSSEFPVSNTFTNDMPLPSEVCVGLAYHITKQLCFTIDFNHTFWHSFDSLGFNFAYNTSQVTDAKSPRLYEDASCVRLGAQWEATEHATFRGGVFFDQTPVRDGYVYPELPDNNKVGVTAGASFKLDNNIHLDLSLLYESVAARTQQNLETGLYGTFQTRVLAPGIGLTYLIRKTNNNTIK